MTDALCDESRYEEKWNVYPLMECGREDLIQDDMFLFDPMSRDKLTAFDSYTYMASSHRFQSILDKIFTSFPAEHCERTEIIDRDQYKDVGLSDHRAVVTQVSLRSLCEGWVEYPANPVNPTPRIRLDRITPEQTKQLKKSVQEWRSGLPPLISAHFLHDPASPENTPNRVDQETLAQKCTICSQTFSSIDLLKR